MKVSSLAVSIPLCALIASASCQSKLDQEQKDQVTVNISLTENVTDAVDMQLFVYPLGIEYDDNTPMQAISDGTYSQTIPTAPEGMYSMVCVKGTSQYSLPLYFMAVSDTVGFNVNLEGDCPSAMIMPIGNDRRLNASAQAGMNALNRFNALYYSLSRKIWTEAQSMNVQELKDMISEYVSLERQTARDRKVSDNVKQYVRIWSYLQQFESCSVFNRMNNDKVDIFNGDDALLCQPHMVLDSEYALLHQATPSTAAQAIPKGTLDERLNYISSNYSNDGMREVLQRSVLNSYIRNYNFSGGYEEGLESLTAAKDTYGIGQSYIDAFMERVSSTPGAPFPNVGLIDTDGNTVTIDKFRGKYVYVDLWASWCIPCCKEVPYLQKLEKDMKGSNVVFVSISVDESQQAWRDKMAELDMHGNQLWNNDNKLCDRLNVSGIPHFLIYDKEGRLHTYSAQRPSSGDALKNILTQLE